MDADLRLHVLARDGDLLWESSQQHQPRIWVGNGSRETRELSLADATDVSSRPYGERDFNGQRIVLSGYPNTDVVLELIVALDSQNDELLIQIGQVTGRQTVGRVDQGGDMALPHGSGYMVAADCPDELPGRGQDATQIGGHWTLPILGLTRDRSSMCAIVDTWWDGQVHAHHLPGDRSGAGYLLGRQLGQA